MCKSGDQADLKVVASEDRHDPTGWRCKACGSPVSLYSSNEAVRAARPQATDWGDWWAACDNSACANSDGESVWQDCPDWAERSHAV